jgi:hypothetical protein
VTIEVQQTTEDQFKGLLASILQRKRRLDKENITTANNMASYDAWLVDAVETLLQIELMRRGK